MKWRSYAREIALDALTTLVMFGLMILFFSLFYSTVDRIDLPDSLLSLSDAQLAQMAAQMQSYYIGFVVMLLVANLLLIACYVLSRSIVWGTRGGVSFKQSLASIPKGIAWFLLGSIPLGVIIVSFKQKNIAILIYTVLFMYLTAMLFLNYSQTSKITFGQSLRLSCRWDLALTYLLILGVLYGLYELLKRAGSLASMAALGLCMLVVLCASRAVLEQVQKRG